MHEIERSTGRLHPPAPATTQRPALVMARGAALVLVATLHTTLHYTTLQHIPQVLQYLHMPAVATEMLFFVLLQSFTWGTR
jgi:hypothetical protein